MSDATPTRSMGLIAATGVGVGAIVGGGILALAGVAFETTGPSAILAFTLNGGIALLTAHSFAELASRFPESGGTYTYARKVLSVQTAFAVGWVVWFASVVAAVLYALGFAVFLVPILEQLVRGFGASPPQWLGGRFALLVYALSAVAAYAWSLTRSGSGGGQWATIGKLVLFAILLAGGAWALVTSEPGELRVADSFRPFLEQGGSGLAQAMGYTFIALQGFDLIAAVGGEVREPERTIPRAMFLSLATALAIYIPLLFLIVVVGSPDEPVAALAARDPEILVAAAARSFLGAAGYWLVVLAGVLSMLSALQANLLAASHFARTMASDRTLPVRFEEMSDEFGTPVRAVLLTAVTVAFVLVAVPSVAVAGAASSLIFLASFVLVHGINHLATRRASGRSPFRTRLSPWIPSLGGAACLSLGLYQAVAVPSAGVLVALWLSLGAVLFVTLLAPRARVVDASSEGLDPEIMRLRGRSPLVLVPIANPASAGTMIKLAKAVAPRAVSRVQLLSVVRASESASGEWLPETLGNVQEVLGGAMSAALASGLRPEVLVTVHTDPWSEIVRVARRTRCEKMIVGVGELGPALMSGPLQSLVSQVDADVVILRAPENWDPDKAVRILVPSRAGREQSPMRARLLGHLLRTAAREVTYLGVLPTTADRSTVRWTERELRLLARDEAHRAGTSVVLQRDDDIAAVAEYAAESDLMILGLRQLGRRNRVFSRVMVEMALSTRCPLLMIGQRG